MARRRSKVQSSSLDLFLDTICNAFGGIMFLSILISVLLQFRGKESAVEVDQPTISESESAQIEDRLVKLQSERMELVATIAALENSMVGEDQTEVIELQSRLVQSEKQREQTVKEQIKMSQHIRNVDTQIRDLKHELNVLDQRLIEARASLVDKSNAFNAVWQALSGNRHYESNRGRLLFCACQRKNFTRSYANQTTPQCWLGYVESNRPF